MAHNKNEKFPTVA